MTEEQKRFLHLHIVESTDYDTISKMLGVSRPTLSSWYDKELRQERTQMATVKTLWIRKKIKGSFYEFHERYLSLERKCNYCGITEAQIKQLISVGRLETKRLITRGKTLELDRKDPNKEYDDFNNLTLACYWCNNAKTDTFSEEEFKKVGEVFREIWRKRMEP